MLRFFGKVFVSVAVCVGSWRILQIIDPRFGIVGILCASFFWPRLFARDILRLFSWIKARAYHDAVFHLHGHYYAFDGRQIRFFLIDQSIWIPLIDIEDILEPAISERELFLLGEQVAPLPEIGITAIHETGLMRMLHLRTENRHARFKIIRFKRWLAKNALGNVKRLPSSATDRWENSVK